LYVGLTVYFLDGGLGVVIGADGLDGFEGGKVERGTGLETGGKSMHTGATDGFMVGDEVGSSAQKGFMVGLGVGTAVGLGVGGAVAAVTGAFVSTMQAGGSVG
jgi:hypothetical protein